jgi:excisionase family DNA binding protein
MWLTVKELSEYIKVKEKTLYYLVGKGNIPHYRIGKLVRFRRDEIDGWLEDKKVTSPPKQTDAETIDKILDSFYTSRKGRPDRLKKEVG